MSGNKLRLHVVVAKSIGVATITALVKVEASRDLVRVSPTAVVYATSDAARVWPQLVPLVSV